MACPPPAHVTRNLDRAGVQKRSGEDWARTNYYIVIINIGNDVSCPLVRGET